MCIRDRYLPNNVSVEHDPEEIWESVESCINEVLKRLNKDEIKSLGITNQRETTIAWSKSSGKSLHNAIVWQDTRTQEICDELVNNSNLPLVLKSPCKEFLFVYLFQ